MGRRQGRDVGPSPKGVAGEAESADRKALLRQFEYELP
jgi:hypothetical protein